MVRCMKKCVILGILVLTLAIAVGIVFMMNPPNPKQCALCGHDEIYHAPVLINLETGDVGELKAYRTHPFYPGEISEVQDTGSYSILHAAGAEGITDWGRGAQVTLPKDSPTMKKSLFCRDCRALLSANEAEGYVLLDLHDREQMPAFALTDGAEYTIRDYTVSVFHDDANDRLTIFIYGTI